MGGTAALKKLTTPKKARKPKVAAKRMAPASDDEEAHDHSETEPPRTAKKPRMSKFTRTDDDDDDSKESEEKLAKKGKAGKTKASRSSAVADAQPENLDVKVNEQGEKYIDLGKKRRATVRDFKGTVFLDIREFYGDDDDLKPGKKGLSLQLEQWENLKKGADAVDELFANLRK